GAVTPLTAKLMVSGVVGAAGVLLGPSGIGPVPVPGNVVAASEVTVANAHASVMNARFNRPWILSLTPCAMTYTSCRIGC
ncbi:MAG TPA: hypothetical protein PLJ16_16185, partial [Casimicrobium huifangae]|nr:hypothetical protein [Casimicrobium huifangae]